MKKHVYKKKRTYSVYDFLREIVNSGNASHKLDGSGGVTIDGRHYTKAELLEIEKKQFQNEIIAKVKP